MSEQQRVFLALAISLGIFLVWELVFIGHQPPKPVAPIAAPAQTPNQAPQPTAAAPATAPAKPAAQAAGAKSLVAPTTPVGSNIAPESYSFANELYAGEIQNGNGALKSFRLLKYDEPSDMQGKHQPIELVSSASDTAPGAQASLEIRLGDQTAIALAFAAKDKTIVFTGRNDAGMSARVVVTPRTDAYVLDYEVELVNGSAAAASAGAAVDLSLVPREVKKSGMFGPPPDLVRGLCLESGKLVSKRAKDVSTTPWQSAANSAWGALDRQYFVVALVPTDDQGVTCQLSAVKEGLTLGVDLGAQTLAAGARMTRKFSLFLGPKREDALRLASPLLTDVIDYNLWGIPLGFLARPMVFLLNIFHGWTDSWGVAIMLLTLVVKVLLFPVTFKSSLSMRKMQLLKPELDKLKTRFANDKERQQLEQMKLFREKGVNPMGGCLPMVLQLPVWFALYRTLWTAVDLYQQSFLWVPNLTAKEPFPFMALALGVLQFVQQKLMPTGTDSQQAKMMLYMMPVMMTMFMIQLPSGLVLYILFNSVLTIGQQLVINKRQVTL